MEVFVDVGQNFMLLLGIEHDSAHGSDRSARDQLPHVIVPPILLSPRAIDCGSLVCVFIVQCFGFCQKQFEWL